MKAEMTPAEWVAWHVQVTGQRATALAEKSGPCFPRPACAVGCSECTIACGMASILLAQIEKDMAKRGIAPPASATVH